MRIFKLPDLGEGLQEAEIVTWHVKAGDTVALDQPLVSVETAKAIVDIPSPYAGKIVRLYGNERDVAHVGQPLVAFEGGDDADTGTVVGKVEVGQKVLADAPAAATPLAHGIKATPAVRALARKLNVDLAMVTPTGADGLITANDVQRAARILAAIGPQELLRGVRKVMAQSMTLAHAEVASATIMDDADINAWPEGTSIMLRLIRALVAACRAEPSLNAWYDSQAVGRRLLKNVDLGIAVDTPDGLLVPVLRNVEKRDARGSESRAGETDTGHARAQSAARGFARQHDHAVELRDDRGPLCVAHRGAADGCDRRRRPRVERGGRG